jgi:type I restriction enzyme S subunit
MSTDKNKLIPELRFPEFMEEGEWKEKTLDDTCKLVRGPFGGSLKKEIFVKDGYAVYEQSHAIYSDFSSFRYQIDDEKFSELKRFTVNSGDLIMSCSGTMGKFAMIPKDYEKGVINQALLKLTVKKDYDNLFIKISLETDYNQDRLLSKSAGGAIKNVVSVSQIKELGLAVPSPEEQQKIASCLSSLDEVIAAHSQKLATLKDHKKGLMQNLFPTNSITNDELEITNVPNYRFPEFLEDGEWMEKKLGDKEVSYFINEKTSVDKLNVNSYVSTENMLPEFSGVITSSKLPSLGNFTKFKNGDILISNIRPYLKKVWKADKIGGASNDVLVFRYGSEVLSEFLECIIKNEAFINYVMEGAKGVKMPRGDKDYMQKYIVFIPSKMEQQKIASCLSSLDELITAQTEKIAQLKLHKKGLMQGLFPKSITN